MSYGKYQQNPVYFIGERVGKEFPTLKQRYWGRHFWARGYFCATVGEMTEEMIKEYLEHHFEPDPAKDFKVEP
jgi:putative transposase